MVVFMQLCRCELKEFSVDACLRYLATCMPLGLLPGVTLSIFQEKLPQSTEILFG